MSRLFHAIKGLAEKGDRAAIAVVTGALGDGMYQVRLQDTNYTVPAIGEVQADVGDRVALIVRGKTRQPVALLGPV